MVASQCGPGVHVWLHRSVILGVDFHCLGSFLLAQSFAEHVRHGLERLDIACAASSSAGMHFVVDVVVYVSACVFFSYWLLMAWCCGMYLLIALKNMWVYRILGVAGPV